MSSLPSPLWSNGYRGEGRGDLLDCGDVSALKFLDKNEREREAITYHIPTGRGKLISKLKDTSYWVKHLFTPTHKAATLAHVHTGSVWKDSWWFSLWAWEEKTNTNSILARHSVWRLGERCNKSCQKKIVIFKKQELRCSRMFLTLKELKKRSIDKSCCLLATPLGKFLLF